VTLVNAAEKPSVLAHDLRCIALLCLSRYRHGASSKATYYYRRIESRDKDLRHGLICITLYPINTAFSHMPPKSLSHLRLARADGTRKYLYVSSFSSAETSDSPGRTSFLDYSPQTPKKLTRVKMANSLYGSTHELLNILHSMSCSCSDSVRNSGCPMFRQLARSFGDVGR
jgi:hypothetical protein